MWDNLGGVGDPVIILRSQEKKLNEEEEWAARQGRLQHTGLAQNLPVCLKGRGVKDQIKITKRK